MVFPSKGTTSVASARANDVKRCYYTTGVTFLPQITELPATGDVTAAAATVVVDAAPLGFQFISPSRRKVVARTIARFPIVGSAWNPPWTPISRRVARKIHWLQSILFSKVETEANRRAPSPRAVYGSRFRDRGMYAARIDKRAFAARLRISSAIYVRARKEEPGLANGEPWNRPSYRRFYSVRDAFRRIVPRNNRLEASQERTGNAFNSAWEKEVSSLLPFPAIRWIYPSAMVSIQMNHLFCRGSYIWKMSKDFFLYRVCIPIYCGKCFVIFFRNQIKIITRNYFMDVYSMLIEFSIIS